ncbi:class I SAM-dependent methyltransferase [Exiguobacterium flavidum]|uniref:class I SAM-dependent methyltransferase n=1 Tax=Exiguobacterium flavidum TaxID=2184695 RepID=UPI000DF836B7|nr:class I SAM-dependent methyltransferase [Exiguobacterium flavidum]
MEEQVVLTTCLRPVDGMEEELDMIEASLDLTVIRVARKKKSISMLQKEYDKPILVLDKRRLELYPEGMGEPFFFHPSSAVFRVKQLISSGHDPLVASAKLKRGMTVLDCTLGLGSDSIVMSHAVGAEGKVVGVESRQLTSFLVRRGLSSWKEKSDILNEAMRRIEVVTADSLEYMKTLPANSFDVVFFDPMFEKTITESRHLDPLRSIADGRGLSKPAIDEAKRVARQRVVLKAHFESNWFDAFGFERAVRKSSKFHYGVIELEK